MYAFVRNGEDTKHITHRMIRMWDIPSEAGATKERKSEGVIHGGTASTPSITPSQSASLKTNEVDVVASSASEERILAESRKI
jgi:hypothetical protein